MTKASTTTIKPEEAAHFGKLAAEWWDPDGSSAMLHKLNPLRLSYIREHIDRHFDCDPQNFRPLAGKRALDVGCGAGLLCEPLARLGADVVGVDAAPENIAAAKAHAALSGLDIDYRAADIAQLDVGTFDLITSMEVIEHVADKPAFLAALVDRLDPGGLLILSTPNRTAASRLFLVELSERLGMIPRGTHDWDEFVTPEELRSLCDDVGMTCFDVKGIAFTPLEGLHLSSDTSLNYILAARRA